MWQGTPSHHCAKGFTLIELLLTLALQATLSTVAYPLTALMDKRNRGLDLQRSLREKRRAIDSCKEASHDSRIEKTINDSGHPPSLQALVEKGMPRHLRQHTKARQAVLRNYSTSIRLTLNPYRPPPTLCKPCWSAATCAGPLLAHWPALPAGVAGDKPFEPINFQSSITALQGKAVIKGGCFCLALGRTTLQLASLPWRSANQ